MKRIANKVAVATICYTVSPTTYIRIVDYPSLWELQNDESAECHGVRAYHAPVTGLDLLIFQICTAAEQY